MNFVFVLLYVGVCVYLFVYLYVFTCSVETVEGIPDVGRGFVLFCIYFALGQYLFICPLRCICLHCGRDS